MQPLTQRLRVYGHLPDATSHPPRFRASTPPLARGRDTGGIPLVVILGITPRLRGEEDSEGGYLVPDEELPPPARGTAG